MHSLTEENYLKAIYRLSQKGNMKITPTAIAVEINVNAASVVDMLKKLTEKKLINYDKTKGAKLTDRGSKTALAVIRNHRLGEVFLLEKLPSLLPFVLINSSHNQAIRQQTCQLVIIVE